MLNLRFRKLNKWSWIIILCVLIITSYLVYDYQGPNTIAKKKVYVWGIECEKVKDLLVQGHDDKGNIWATRGMVAYKSSPNNDKFIRQFHIPTGVTLFWLRNFTFIRRLTLRPECVELLPLRNGKVVVMSAGYLWYQNDGKLIKSLKLKKYGIGIGQGIRNVGITETNDGTILLGEYFMNKEKTNVYLYSSKDDGRTWQVAHKYRPKQIRHIHAVQNDPYSNKAWICTGDTNEESMIAWTKNGKTFKAIGIGSQL
jgi:hypothetical protein